MSTPAWKKRARQEIHVKQKEKREYEKLLSGISKVKQEFKDYKPKQAFTRDVKEYPSMSTSDVIPGTCSKTEPQQYSGDYIVGIATMHKSNLVPVGKDQDPAEYATMRRN